LYWILSWIHSQCKSFNTGVYHVYSMTDQTSCCVDDGLELVQELCKKADRQRITVIELCQHKTGDERHNCMTRQQPVDAPQLAQDTETACTSSGDVCHHGRMSVQVDAEVSNGADRRNVIGADTERYGGNLVHASTRRTPHHFSLRRSAAGGCFSSTQICRRYGQKRHSENLLNSLYHRSRTPVCRPRTDGLEGCAHPPVG